MKRVIYLFIVLISLFSCMIISASADTEFAVSDLEKNDKEHVLETINLKFIQEAPARGAIEHFAISDDGQFAIGRKNGFSQLEIAIYSDEGEFKCGYSMSCNGSFALDFSENDCLNIYMVRSEILLSVDLNGAVISVASVDDTPQNSDYYNEISDFQKNVGGNLYAVKNDNPLLNLLGFSYSKLTKTDKNGTETVLYEADATTESLQLVIIICIVIVVLAALIGLLIFLIKFDKKNLAKSEDDNPDYQR